jgi:hypothetical protein
MHLPPPATGALSIINVMPKPHGMGAPSVPIATPITMIMMTIRTIALLPMMILHLQMVAAAVEIKRKTIHVPLIQRARNAPFPRMFVIGVKKTTHVMPLGAGMDVLMVLTAILIIDVVGSNLKSWNLGRGGKWRAKWESHHWLLQGFLASW